MAVHNCQLSFGRRPIWAHRVALPDRFTLLSPSRSANLFRDFDHGEDVRTSYAPKCVTLAPVPDP